MDDSCASLRLDPNAGGKLLDAALAKRKPAQSYRGHVTDVYRAWCGLVAAHKPLLERGAARAQIPLPRLLQSSLLCVALHDVGKLSDNFQQMMLASDESQYRLAVQRNYRHEIAALWFIKKAAQALSKQYGPIPGGGILEVLAVAGHHKYLTNDSLFAEDRFLQTLKWKPNAWNAACAAYKLANAMFVAQGWELPRQNRRQAGRDKSAIKQRSCELPVRLPLGGQECNCAFLRSESPTAIPRFIRSAQRVAHDRRLDG